ncbi:uncharacterized protein LOC123481509 [Coregonus clupeaformis]|uniref:uncharacterized protein LOC123481509 n=1 Tax=Coregonus clupeaformis TaxID=59861 RepID=UPI001E1C418F|nr:uncharacterized protein LOC123481509 [Coregonus clupeaformis]
MDQEVSLEKLLELFDNFTATSLQNLPRRHTVVSEDHTRSVIDSSSLTARGVVVAECPCEDGPRLEPLPIAKSSRGERNRRFPCKHIPVELGPVGFDIVYKLWTLPYNFLSRIVCATASIIVRRRRGFQARIEEDSTAPRALMKMDSELLHSPAVCLAEEEEADMSDWNLPLAFMKKRHSEKIEGSKALAQSWRMKDRMKTVSVALVLCLNVGVDPPDVVKTSPCARLECWIDPLSMSPQKALETIGANLQKQYENWQPRRDL